MKAQFLNPFIESLAHVLKVEIGENPVKGDVFLREKSSFKSKDITVIIGISGELYGQAVITMDRDCGMNIAAAMMGQPSVDTLDESSRSALCELANMVTANAAVKLEAAGYSCDITIPSLVTGAQIIIACPEKSNVIVIPVQLPQGEIDINLSMSEAGGVERYADRFKGIKPKKQP